MGAMSGWLLSLDGNRSPRWQWLFLISGAADGARWTRCASVSARQPGATAPRPSAPEKDWIYQQLAREQQAIGAPASHNVLAAFVNPLVLMFGAIGITCIGAFITFTLSAPMILAEATGLDVTNVGYLVSVGGVIGTAATLYLGNLADRNGDRFILGFWCAAVMAASLLTIRLAPSPLIVGIAYLAFST